MATLLPYLWNCGNELINESTDAVSDSVVTELSPGWGHKGGPAALRLPGHRRLGRGRFGGKLGKV